MSRADGISEAALRRLAEASGWRVALAEAEADTSPEFESWRADPCNARAWEAVQSGWQAVEEQADSPELLALRRDALDRAHRAARRRRSATSWRRIAAAACLLLIAGLAALVAPPLLNPQARIVATELGERRVVTLSDGSRLSLDSGSEVRVRYTAETRGLELVRGQARFDVAHDDARRFVVRAADRVIVATGTAFNVDLAGGQVLVTLIEGSVLVLPDEDEPADPALAARSRGVPLRAGQRLIAAPRAPPVVQPASLDRVTAWERGQLVFEDETLAEIAARVGRYSPHPIRVERGAEHHRVSAVFQVGDIATFIDTVTHYLPVRATRESDGSLVLAPRA